ncbi:MAG: hypothetical protein RSC65_02940 [Malacoplasma sp.]
MKTKINKNKILALSIAILSTFSISFALSSCSEVNSSLISNSISKDTGTMFASNATLEDIVKESSQSEVGKQAILNYYSGKMSLNWLENVAAQEGQITYKHLIEDKKKEIDKEYSDLYKTYKNDHNANADLLFQQNVLDLAGGTESSWKESKLFTWAKDEVIKKIFEQNYLTINVNGTAQNNLSETDMLKALKDSSANFDAATNSTIATVQNGFAFNKDAISSGKNEYVDTQYSKFQQFIFDNWAQMDAPFIINMSLWKYSQPEKGINDLFSAASAPTTDENGNQTGGGASYQFPYFADQNKNNDQIGTISKFKNFVTNAATTSNYITDTTTGLKNIPKTHTEDSSTFILAKNSKIYNDLYIEFAAAASHLFKSTIENTTQDASLKKKVNLNTTLQTNNNDYDTISLNFINSTKTNLNDKAITLKKELVAQIINDLGPLKTKIADTHTLDAFIPNETSLSEFMFLRNEAGVHAISIDGSTFIKDTTSPVNKNKAKYNAANVALYRSLWANLNSDQFTLDIKSELNTFFSDWSNYLIIKYALLSENDLFSEKSLKLQATEKDFITKLNTLLFEEKMFPKQREYQNKLFDTKNAYAKNYGVSTKNNGFAAPWIYSGTSTGGAGELVYGVSENLYTVTDPYSTSGSNSLFLTSLNSLLTTIKVTPLESNFAGFKYSQYIYSNQSMWNNALLAYGSDGNSLGNKVKANIIKEYLGTDINVNLEFTSTLFPTSTTLNKVNSYATNLYFSSIFNGSSNKWSGFSSSDIGTTTAAQISTHMKKLWFDGNKKNTLTSSDNYISYLSFASTVKYLLSDNAKEFINYLKNKIYLGQDAYVAWLSSQNTYLTPSGQISANSAALGAKVSVNLNNSFKTIYTNTAITSSTPAVDINNDTSSLFTNGNSQYYNIVDNKTGFLGIQTKEKNELPSSVAKDLFEKPKSNNNPNGDGILYSYIDQTKLIDTITNFSLIQSVENLATEIFSKTGAIDLNAILNKEKNLEEKKAELINQIKTSLSGTASTKIYSARDVAFPLITDETNNRLQYGVNVKQLNTNDTSTMAKLITRIGEDAFYNLVISFSMDSQIQNATLLSLSETRKVVAYDTRVNKQLNSQWVKNWVAQ